MTTEIKLEPCSACENSGMVAGDRCATCNGQGHLRIKVAHEDTTEEATPATTEEPTGPELVDPKAFKLPELQALAQVSGLEITGTKAELAERINAHLSAAAPTA